MRADWDSRLLQQKIAKPAQSHRHHHQAETKEQPCLRLWNLAGAA
jgi:hypothetical protein